MSQRGLPVTSLVPGDSARVVGLDRQYLRDTVALDENDEGADTSSLLGTLFAALDIRDDKGIGDVCPRDDAGVLNRESSRQRVRKAASEINNAEDIPAMRFGVAPGFHLNQDRIFGDIPRHSLELERLETSPAEKKSVRRGKFAKILGCVFM